MATNRDVNTEAFNTPGERLHYLLDQIGFKQGRGRVAEFQSFLMEQSPEGLEDLKYTTVRSWFYEHAPAMRKIDAIIEALQKKYTINQNISQIKTWWKLGGYFPFPDQSAEAENIQKELYEKEQKLQFQIMSLVTEETGDRFAKLSGRDLLRIKEKALTFATDYADPSKVVCPHDYIRLVIQNELDEILLNK